MQRNAKPIAVAKAKQAKLRLFFFSTAILLLSMLILIAASSSSKAGIYGVFPQCNSTAVEFRLRDRFNEAEEKQWQRGFQMSKLRGMHEHETGYWKDSEILRRYCNATAIFSNGQRRQVYYLLEETGGFVGKNWGLTYCVAGLDPWNNHDSNCRTLR